MVIIGINHQPSGGKEWVAEILGREKAYGVKRRFLVSIDRKWSSSGKTGTTYFELEAGKLYQIKPSHKERYFVVVKNNQIETPTTQEVVGMLDQLDRGEPIFQP